jgi:hypothetical protein
VATINSLVERVRFELGDMGRSFVTQFTAGGTTNRYRLHYAPLDGASVIVTANNVDITNDCSVEESTGVLVTDNLLNAGVEVAVSGTYYRYFTAAELATLVTTAIGEHSARSTDALGREITVANLPAMEEYPVSVYATTLALYTLATDAAFDIDIQAPDGVTIPRAERYRQLMEMITTRQAQYRDLCVQLGVGLYKIDVFTLRRISKMTNRYVPVYKPMEVDDRSFPQRASIPEPTYGDQHAKFPTESGDLTAYQGRKFATNISFTGNWAGSSFVARLYYQRGSVQIVQNFAMAVTSDQDSWIVTGAARTSGNAKITITTAATHDFTSGQSVFLTDVDDALNGEYIVTTPITSNTFSVMGTATTALALTSLDGLAEHSTEQTYIAAVSLTSDQTFRLANRTWWKITAINSQTDENLAVIEGNFFTVRASEVIL